MIDIVIKMIQHLYKTRTELSSVLCVKMYVVLALVIEKTSPLGLREIPRTTDQGGLLGQASLSILAPHC